MKSSSAAGPPAALLLSGSRQLTAESPGRTAANRTRTEQPAQARAPATARQNARARTDRTATRRGESATAQRQPPAPATPPPEERTAETRQRSPEAKPRPGAREPEPTTRTPAAQRPRHAGKNRRANQEPPSRPRRDTADRHANRPSRRAGRGESHGRAIAPVCGRIYFLPWNPAATPRARQMALAFPFPASCSASAGRRTGPGAVGRAKENARRIHHQGCSPESGLFRPRARLARRGRAAGTWCQRLDHVKQQQMCGPGRARA